MKLILFALAATLAMKGHPADSTRFLQAALSSGAKKVVVNKQASATCRAHASCGANTATGFGRDSIHPTPASAPVCAAEKVIPPLAHPAAVTLVLPCVPS